MMAMITIAKVNPPTIANILIDLLPPMVSSRLPAYNICTTIINFRMATLLYLSD